MTPGMKQAFKEAWPLSVLMLGGAALSYWWQVEQGSTDLEWNIGMAILGAVGGLCLYMGGQT